MGVISRPVAIGDIANAEAFVQRAISKSGIDCSADEREVLLAEGLTILCELHAKYKPLPARPGIDKQAGRFSGYAAMFLPRRLGDFWHKSHPEHRYVTDQRTGRRGWIYGPMTLSLDGLIANGDADDGHGGERLLLHAKPLTAFCHATTNRM